MSTSIRSSRWYRSEYAANLGALSVRQQARLRASRVALAGSGGVGSLTASALAMVGVRRFVLIDPQCLEIDNLNRSCAGVDYVGVSKALACRSVMQQRFPEAEIAAFVSPVETVNPEVFNDCDVIISAPNAIKARRAAARIALRKRIPIISAGLADCRKSWSGAVTVWHPGYGKKAACPACFLNGVRTVPRGESLLTTVVLLIASLTAQIAVQILTGARAQALRSHNFFRIDAGNYVLEKFAVRRLKDCEVCGVRN